MNNSFNLINDTFEPQDARQILMTVFASKIKFHEKKNLGYIVSKNLPDSNSNERIAFLKEQMQSIQNLIDSLQESDKLEINCDIHISKIEDAKK